MKQELHGSRTNCQTRLDIGNAKFRKLNILFGLPLNDGFSDIFLIRNKGKGPPGRTRSPGLASGFTRDIKLAAFKAPHPELDESVVTEPVECKNSIENEIITIINKSKFLSQLNFTIMKKQIQILAFFILVFWAGIMTSFGQNTSAKPGTAPTPLAGCTDDALHPLPGKEYTYQSTATPSGGTYTWWATTDQTFIKTVSGTTTNNLSTMILAGSGILTPSASYGVSSSDDNVKLTWTSTLLSTTTYNTAPTFVVVQYDAGASGCSNNLKVYQLDPMRGFTVDIKNLDKTGASLAVGTSTSQCIDNVRSAKFNGTTIDFDYGINYFSYEVIAANFTGTWTPTFTLTGYNAVQTPTIQWSYDPPSAWASTTWHNATDPVTTTETNTSGGVSIFVRVTLENKNYEGIKDQIVSLAVAGTDVSTKFDLNNADCTQPADAATAQADDIALQTQTARPTLPSTTTSPTIPNTKLVTGNEVNNP